MMKFLTIVAILLVPFMGFSQDKGFSIKADILSRMQFVQKKSNRLVLQPGIALSRSVHNFRLAPIIRLKGIEAQTDQYKPRLTGVSLAYELMMDSEVKFLQQYFYFESAVQSISNKWTANYYSNALQGYVPYSYETREFFNSNMLGYGFNIKLIGDFYLHHSIAGGVFFSELKNKPQAETPPTLEETDFRGYPDFGFTHSLTFGFGYKF